MTRKGLVSGWLHGILLPGEHQFSDFLAQFAYDCFNLDELPGSRLVPDRLNSSKSLQTLIDQRRSKATKIVVSNRCPLCAKAVIREFGSHRRTFAPSTDLPDEAGQE